MDTAIRDWRRDDVAEVARLWLDALGEADLEGMTLHFDAAHRLRVWLVERVRERSSIGLVAEVGGQFGGFLLGRVGEWDSVPPIVLQHKTGIVDVICVRADLRNQGVGTRLVAEAMRKMEARDAVRIETICEVGNEGARRLWTRAGFRPSLQRMWKPVDGAGQGETGP